MEMIVRTYPDAECMRTGKAQMEGRGWRIKSGPALNEDSHYVVVYEQEASDPAHQRQLPAEESGQF